MREYSRRHFLKAGFTGAGALMTVPSLFSAESAAGSFKGNDIVPLGKTGIKVSRLAFGTGFNGYNQSSELGRSGKENFDHVFRHGLDQGIKFIDMADLYGTHPFVKDCIKDLPRDKYVLLSKIWTREESWVTPSGGAKAEIDRFRQELGVEQLDVTLIHCMSDAKWATEQERVRDELSEMKQKGAVRAVGVSCHDFGALKVASEHPWVDVIFARINNKGGKGYDCDATVEELSAVLKTARKNGKAVVGMKIFGAGKLVKPEEKDASLSYVFQNNLVDAITIGFLKTEQVDDTLQRMAAVKAA